MISTTQINKGINQDVIPKFQPEGTYRDALNIVDESISGDYLARTNELGNVKVDLGNSWDYSATTIGSVVLDTDESVIFTKNETTNVSSIWLVDLKGLTTTLLSSASCLNFSLEHQINAIYKVRNGCERVVYFTDNYNDYRVINVDKAKLSPVTSCHELQYTKDLSAPIFNVVTDGASFSYIVRDFGGSLKYGTYAFSLRYLDAEDNPTDWIFHSYYVPVGHGTSSEMALSSMKGASNNKDNKFYEFISNKSIALTWNNLDTRFKRYQVAVIKRTTDDGTIENIDVLNPITYETSSSQFIYTGSEDQVIASATLDEVLVPTQRVEKCNAHSFHLNRLFVGNVTNQDRDYSGYQRLASAIKTKYLANAKDQTDTREPQRYIGAPNNGLGLLQDEVYALGIVYIHTDGTLSPVFHIPGRPAINNSDGSFGTNPYIAASSTWDTATLSGDNNIYNASKNKRWQVYNTATIEAGLPSQLKGLLGYYETSTSYPIIEACDAHADGYWGRDWAGNLLENTKIRHHRIPSEEIVSYNLSGDTTVAPAKRTVVGLQFSNITYPSDVVGHYFVYGDRKGNETIIDKGILTPVYDYASKKFTYTANWYQKPIAATTETTIYGFMSPSILYRDINKQGTYLKINRVGKDKLSNSNVVSATQTKNTSNFNLSIEVTSLSMDFNRYSRPTRLNYGLVASKYIPKTPVLTFTGASNDGSGTLGANFAIINSNKVYNSSRTNNVLLLATSAAIEEAQLSTIQYQCLYATLKADSDVYQNLDVIQYKLLSSYPKYGTSDFNVYYSADVFDTEFDIHNIGLQLYSGSPVAGVGYGFTRHYLQSDININYRSNIPKTNEKDQFYNYNQAINFAGNHNNICDYAASRVDDFSSAGDENALYPLIDLYDVMPAYNYLRPEPIYYSLPYRYDHCKECKESFPYRIYYSEVDDIEPENDDNRIIKVNNYKDLEGNTGPITDIFTLADNLYAFTTGSLHYIPTRPQQLSTSEGVIQIGTGEVLSAPVRQIKTTDQKYGGINHFKAKHISEHGLFYVDSYSRTPFRFQSSLSPVSDGLRNFFKENATFKINEVVKLATGLDYPYISTSSPKGIGFFVGYDPRHARVLIHKNDYEITDLYKRYFFTDVSPINGSPFGLYWNGTNWYKSNGTTVSITNFNDVEVFNNISFVVSYSLLSNAWISFHSYSPYYIFNTHNTFYTNNLWEHNKGEYQVWYEQPKQDSMLDIVIRQQPNFQQFTSDIWYSANSSINDNPTEETFDRVWIYNTNQSSGIISLVPKKNFMNSVPTQALVSATDRKYRINGFKDFTADYTKRISDPGTYPVSRVPVNLNYSKSLFENLTFKDYFIGTRLYTNHPDNLKISLDLVNTQHYNKQR